MLALRCLDLLEPGHESDKNFTLKHLTKSCYVVLFKLFYYILFRGGPAGRGGPPGRGAPAPRGGHPAPRAPPPVRSYEHEEYPSYTAPPAVSCTRISNTTF